TYAVGEQLGGVGPKVHAVGRGDRFDAAGFDVGVFGELHAVVNPAWPTVANVGFLVDGRPFHPGDAYTVPETEVDTRLPPTNAPWLTATELISSVAELSPSPSYAVH